METKNLIAQNFKDLLEKVRIYIKKLYIRPDKLLIYIFVLAISILLIGSIYSSINDIKKFKMVEDEQKILDELIAENNELLKERNYYKSSFYRRLYARESLALAKENQDIFFVDRSNESNFARPEENIDPIDLQNIRFWWTKLIF